MNPSMALPDAPLYSIEATRAIEAAAQQARPPFALMAQAGQSVARLAHAVAPHARCIWVACGPGNNGGDGLVAATLLHQQAQKRGNQPQVLVTLDADESRMPADATRALAMARQAGVPFSTEVPAQFDLAIDALLGIGARPPVTGTLAQRLDELNRSKHPVLCVDVPSGLNADTGSRRQAPPGGQRHTLSLLTLKPGLFMAEGRDACGQIWFDDLGVTPANLHPISARCSSTIAPPTANRQHATHKGTFGDVLVIGGQHIALNGSGMTGAAVLAARAALHAGAGRVYVGLLETDGTRTAWDPTAPELMFRSIDTLAPSALLSSACTVCGCGGGDALAAWLPTVLADAPRLVLDADALNAIARSPDLQTRLTQRQVQGWTTVLTPHPLEAARLLGVDTGTVMIDRLHSASALCERYKAVCVLKGSGTVIAAPHETPRINTSGNGALATAGTGDVLAGWIGTALAHDDGTPAVERVAQAVYRHGWLADKWCQQHPNKHLTAGQLVTATP